MNIFVLYLNFNLNSIIVMTSWAISSVFRIISDLDVYRDERSLSSDAIDAWCLSLELVFRELIVQQTFDRSDQDIDEACEIIRHALNTTSSLREHINLAANEMSTAVVRSGRAGRPIFDIGCEQLSFLIENRFTVRQIAAILGVSERTVYRRMSDFTLSVHDQYATLSDDELDHLVYQVHSQFPTCGNQQMLGHLFAQGYRVQQIRVRESLRRIDPEGCMIRQLRVINRRQYRVPSPRSLWHIDGNHKLIR